MMKITRLVELSLFYRLQDILSVSRNKEIPKSADFRTYNLKYSNVLTNYPFVVYIDDVISDSGFSVDYLNGLIKFDIALTSVTKVQVDYTYCSVNVYDESKNPLSDDFKYPAVAIYEEEGEEVGFELGSNKKQRHSEWIFEVWSERGGERNDITDTILESFEDGTIYITDYNVAFPINSDGSKNAEFNAENQKVAVMYCDSINYSKAGSLDIGDKPMYMSQIFIDLVINK